MLLSSSRWKWLKLWGGFVHPLFYGVVMKIRSIYNPINPAFGINTSSLIWLHDRTADDLGMRHRILSDLSKLVKTIGALRLIKENAPYQQLWFGYWTERKKRLEAKYPPDIAANICNHVTAVYREFLL